MLNSTKVKKDFPILNRKIHGRPLVYLDNAATSQKPSVVINAVSDYYQKHNANVHRGIHTLGDEATVLYDQARQTVADFIGASHKHEIVFTRNTTESINLVANSWGSANLKKGDVILTTQMEHHSNLVPWQVIAKELGATVKYITINQDGTLNLSDFKKKLTKKVKLVAIVHASNFLGTINPIEKLANLAHKVGVKVIVDGAQATPHIKVDVSKLGVDFYCFSGHKMLAPMGIGVLWAKREILESMKPFLFGGGMISQVSLSDTSYAKLPDKFDAGTPNVSGAIGLMAAIDYINSIGIQDIHHHEQRLSRYAIKKLSKIKGLKIFGPKSTKDRVGVIAFTLKGVHAHDVAQILDRQAGVAVRSGHHCTMPMHTHLNLAATTRASFYLYNTTSDIDQLVGGIKNVKRVFK